MIRLRDMHELVHAQVESIIAPSLPSPHGPLPRMACSLHHTVRWRAPRWAPSADDLYRVADAPLLTHAVQAWDQHLRAARMRRHMGRLNVWCPAGQNALPPAMREHCTPDLPVLGNTIEKSRGNLVRSNIGSADEAWTEIADKISGACARLRELVGAGLAHPTAQSVFRVWSGPDLNSPERR